jgi:hypothetical protein
VIVEVVTDSDWAAGQAEPWRSKPLEPGHCGMMMVEGHCPSCHQPFGPPEYISDYRDDYGDQPWLRCDGCAWWMRLVR